MTAHLFDDTAVLTGRTLRHVTRSIDTIADEYLSIVLDGISAVPVSTT